MQTDSPRRLIALAGGKQVKFAAVINDELIPTALVGNYRQHHALPVKTTVKFDQPYVVYDLQKKDESTRADHLDLSFNRSEARLMALVNEPFEKIKAEVNTEVQAGQILRLKIEVIDQKGISISDPLPFELSLLEPSGKEHARFLRTLSPDETFEFRAALSAPVGEWRFKIHELVSGLEVSLAWRLISSPERPLFARQLPSIMIQDAAAIRRFISEKSRVRLLLEAGQEQFEPLAEQIAAVFRERGRESEVRVVQAEDIHVVPLRWRRTERDQKVWDAMERGETIGYRLGLRTYFDPKQQVDYVLPYSGYQDPGPQYLIFDHVVLIGLPAQSGFLEEAQTLAPRQVTRFYPGQGRGLVQHVWSPFWAGKHAVTIGAFDEDGLESAVQQFVEIMRAENEAEDTPSARISTSSNRQTFTSNHVDAQTGISLEDSGSPITSLSISPDGNYIGVGAQFYGDNLFLLDKEGGMLWKDHVGIQGPDSVTVSKDAERTYAQFGGKLLFFDRKGRGLNRFHVPGASVGANRWSPGPNQLSIHTQSQDLLLGGRQSLERIGPDGKTKWRYSDIPWCQEALDFYHHRACFIKAVSPDGNYILTALFGVQIGQLGYLSAYWKPGLALLDAESGEVLWRRQGVTMNNTLGITTGERTVVCDDDGVFQLLNANGEEERSFAYPDGLEDMKLSPDGRQLVLRNAMARNHILQPYGRSMNLVRLDLSTTISHRYDTSGELRDFDISPDGKWVVASTWSDAVYLFHLEGKKAWQTDAPGGCLVRFDPSGKSIVAGTATGSLIWLDLDGRRIRTIDLIDSNFPRQDFVRSVQDDEEFPELEIQPPQEQLLSLFERTKEEVDFKPVELPNPLRGRINVLE